MALSHALPFIDAFVKTVAEARANADTDKENRLYRRPHSSTVLKPRSMQLEHRDRYPALWKLRAHNVRTFCVVYLIVPG